MRVDLGASVGFSIAIKAVAPVRWGLHRGGGLEPYQAHVQVPNDSCRICW